MAERTLAALKLERERLGADVRAVTSEIDPETLRSSLERRLGQLGEALRSNP